MSKPWFAPKRFGYGAGLPISWEGWTTLAAFLGGIWAVLYFSRLLSSATEIALVRLIGVTILIAAFVAIARAKTEGGWHWRNGEH